MRTGIHPTTGLIPFLSTELEFFLVRILLLDEKWQTEYDWDQLQFQIKTEDLEKTYF
jgi:hypothetical protein